LNHHFFWFHSSWTFNKTKLFWKIQIYFTLRSAFEQETEQNKTRLTAHVSIPFILSVPFFQKHHFWVQQLLFFSKEYWIPSLLVWSSSSSGIFPDDKFVPFFFFFILLFFYFIFFILFFASLASFYFLLLYFHFIFCFIHLFHFFLNFILCSLHFIYFLSFFIYFYFYFQIIFIINHSKINQKILCSSTHQVIVLSLAYLRVTSSFVKQFFKQLFTINASPQLPSHHFNFVFIALHSFYF